MPGVYQAGEMDLVGTIVGVVGRDEIIDGSHIKAGDVILGLPSSGLHTNGYTMARKALEDLEWSEPLAELNGDAEVLQRARLVIADAPAEVAAAIDYVEAVAEQLSQELPDLPAAVKVTRDPIADRGPIVGLLSGLRAAAADALTRELKSHLVKELGQGGPARAVRVCAEVAQAVAASRSAR